MNMSRLNGKFASLAKASSVDCSLLVSGGQQAAVCPPETHCVAVNGVLVDTVAVNNREPAWYDSGQDPIGPTKDKLRSDVSASKIGRRLKTNRIGNGVEVLTENGDNAPYCPPLNFRQLWRKALKK
jgi:hypothetical protein